MSRPEMEIAQKRSSARSCRSCLPRRAEAIEIANGTDYGLVAASSPDLDRATRAASRLRAGQVFVNEWYAGGVETPFGGFGKSGYGREKGREALWNYVQTKNVAIRKLACMRMTGRSSLPRWSRALFDEDLFLKGTGTAQGDAGRGVCRPKNLAAADDFTRPFQEAMTAWCWGFGWGDDVIDAKTRSMMNLAMIGALGKMTNGKPTAAGALNNGVTRMSFARSSTWSASIAACRRRWSVSASLGGYRACICCPPTVEKV
jgi:hypothetical protein